MQILQVFWRDTRGNSMHAVAMAAATVALASLAGTHFLEKAVQTGALQDYVGGKSVPSAEFRQVMASLPKPGDPSRESIRQVTIDYTPTGSIPSSLAQPIVLDPCTGTRK